MTRMLPLIALVAAACSPEPSNSTAPVNATVDVAETPAAAVPPSAAAVDPKPGDLKTFRDWTVGCDNGLTCTMASLGPEAGDFPTATMRVMRDAGPAGDWRIELDAHDGDPAGLTIDRKRLASDDDIAGAEAAAVAAAMVNGTTLTVIDSAGKAMGNVSLAGASAALRYTDAMQGRADGVTAAVAKGSKPASAVPAAPALPTITAVTPGGTAATLTATQLAEVRKLAECDAEGFASTEKAESHALGGGATLVFVPCSAGAYNFSSALFVLQDGKLSPATADVASGFGESDAINSPAQVVNGDFEDGIVTSYAKGRGIGDCGVGQDFAWDGSRLRLVGQREMGECRGNTDQITTWRATVVRK